MQADSSAEESISSSLPRALRVGFLLWLLLGTRLGVPASHWWRAIPRDCAGAPPCGRRPFIASRLCVFSCGVRELLTGRPFAGSSSPLGHGLGSRRRGIRGPVTGSLPLGTGGPASGDAHPCISAACSASPDAGGQLGARDEPGQDRRSLCRAHFPAVHPGSGRRPSLCTEWPGFHSAWKSRLFRKARLLGELFFFEFKSPNCS